MPETSHLFDKIAGHYDLLNTVFSLGTDKYWRKELSGEVSDRSLILDIATGTAEVAITISENHSCRRIVGIDPSIKMLGIGLAKIHKFSNIDLVQGMNEHLPFASNTFDAVTIAFGIRNTKDLELSLQEILRVLKPHGKLSILEFTTPNSPFFRPVFLLYSRYIMPLIGSLFGSRREYKYLSDSSASFPQRERFKEIMRNTGFKYTDYRELTMGISAIYNGIKST